MPKIYVQIDEYVDIDTDDYLELCTSSEKKELVIALKEDGYWDTNSSGSSNITDGEWSHALEKLSGMGRLRLTSEEEEIIKKIASRL